MYLNMPRVFRIPTYIHISHANCPRGANSHPFTRSLPRSLSVSLSLFSLNESTYPSVCAKRPHAEKPCLATSQSAPEPRIRRRVSINNQAERLGNQRNNGARMHNSRFRPSCLNARRACAGGIEQQSGVAHRTAHTIR